MIAMALVVRLPTVWIGGLGVGTIVFHNLLDWMSPASLGTAAGLWNFLHVPGFVSIAPQIGVIVGYPLIPWVGVMAAGYALGAMLEKPDRRKRVFLLGAGVTLAFFLLRFLNLYENGNPSQPSFFPWTVGPWKFQANPALTVMAFFNTLKYPPSLDYLLMTLGPALIILARLDSLTAERGLGRILLVFWTGSPFLLRAPHLLDPYVSRPGGSSLSSAGVLALAGRICSQSGTPTYGHPLI
jgi:uncharacterized membrane protein